MPEPLVTVAIPTLNAGTALAECLASLELQTLRNFEIVVIDNSGKRLVREMQAAQHGITVIENAVNVGFGAAVNQAFRRSKAPYLATLNDDAAAYPDWLEALVKTMQTRPDAGMCASQVRLPGGGQLDSAGMLISSDATSKQRGHLEAPEEYAEQKEVLLPSGSAALYRRRMLEQIGPFDESFFLYCEDTDLGLRARWAGWACLYAPGAVVEHRYSQSAGIASPLKAYYVERNRLFVLIKNYPGGLMRQAPLATATRYFWHITSAFSGRGSAAKFREENSNMWQMAYIAARAHVSLLKHGRRLLRQRREIRRTAKIGTAEFEELVRQNYISPREVAAL